MKPLDSENTQRLQSLDGVTFRHRPSVQRFRGASLSEDFFDSICRRLTHAAGLTKFRQSLIKQTFKIKIPENIDVK